MLGSFNETTCSVRNSLLPNLTQVINHRLDFYDTLWDIYSDICMNQLKNDNPQNKWDKSIITGETPLQNIFLQNYSIFLQSLLISLIKAIDKKPIVLPLAKISEKISKNPIIDFFLGNQNETNFFVSADTNDTILTAMCNAQLSSFNNAEFFEKLIKKALIKLNSENIIKFLSHKNYLGLSALTIAMQSKKQEFLTRLLQSIKKIIIENPKNQLYDLFFDENLISSSNESCSLINKAIMINNSSMFITLMEGIEEIFGINHLYYSKFINNNLPVPPIVLTALLAQEENFDLLVEKASLAYRNQSQPLIDYFAQTKFFEKNNIEIVSILHLIIKLNVRLKNIEILNTLIPGGINKTLTDQIEDNRLRNDEYLFNLSDSLINALLKGSSNNSEVIFNYFTLSNSKGETLLHLIDNQDVTNNNLLVRILNKLNIIFHVDHTKFINIINYRDFKGYTPFLVMQSSKEKDRVQKLLVDNYPIEQKVQPYSSLFENKKNLYKDDISLFEESYLSAYSTTYGNLLSFDQLTKESIFSLVAYLFEHVNAQALIARVQEIKHDKPDLSQLDQEEETQISIYQYAIESFYNYTLDRRFPFIAYYKGYVSDSVDMLNSTLAELFITNQYQYVLLHKTQKDMLLIGKPDISYFLFSPSLFSPLKKFRFSIKNDIQRISLWIKKYFLIDPYPLQGYILYPFNLYKNLTHAEFHILRLKENVQHYRDRINQLNLTIIITDKMLLEQKILDLPIKVIQKFFFLDNSFITLEKFKENKKNFFDSFANQLTFRVELMEDYFFTLLEPEKQALQSILIAYPTISFEKYDKYFKALEEDKKVYLELQRQFLEFYGENILSKIRLESFNITEWRVQDLYMISLETYKETIDAIDSDFIDELMKFKGKETVMNFLYQEKIKPLINNLKSRKPRAIKHWETIFFPALSSLPYAIKSLAKMTTHSFESAVNEFLTAIAPWLDLGTPALIDKLDKNLPPQLSLAIKFLHEKCPKCVSGLSRIAKNFPIFSIVIITKSLVDTLNDCDLSQSYTANYCLNTISNIFMSYVIAATDTFIPIQTEEEIKHTAMVLLTLISHGIGIETYYQYKKLTDQFNLSELGFFQKSYLALGTALGSISTDNFNYATIGIESKDLVFATLERFIDNHAKQFKLDYTYAALAIPNIEEKHEQKILESGKVFPIFSIENLPDFDFIFTKNTTFCHDPSGIKITPDHAQKFAEEYNLGIGTFVKLLGPDEKKCSKGQLITAPFIAKTDHDAKAIILTNTLPESERKHLRLSSVNFLFGLIDPATFKNYTWTFREDYQKSDSKELIGFIIKRIIPLQEAENPHLARIKITGEGLVRPDVVENTYSINFGIYSSTIGKNAELVIEPSEETPIKQFFGFYSPLHTDLFYFDGDTLTNKKGLSIINLKQVKNLGLEFANQFYTTQNSIISIPCNHTFTCNGGLANASYPFQLARPACDFSLYHTVFYFPLMPGTQFIYNNTLKFVVDSFQITRPFYPEGLLIVYIHKQEEFKLSKNIFFDQITIIPSIKNLILEFNLNNTTARLYLSLPASAENLDNYSHRIEGYWSEKTNNTKVYLSFLKNKGQIWKTKLAAIKLAIEEPSITTIEEEAIKINKNNSYDEIVIQKSISFMHFFFPRENDVVITGDFTGYSLNENKLSLTVADFKKSTVIILPKTRINLVDINNVSYFMDFETNRMLAVNIKGSLTHRLLAPLRIADNLEHYSKVTPINSLSPKFIQLLQFNDELVSVRYFDYYQFITNRGRRFLKQNDAQVSKKWTISAGETNSMPLKILEHSASYAPKILTQQAVASSATQSVGWLNTFFKFILNVKNNFNLPVLALDRPKDFVSKKSISLDHCIPGAILGDLYRSEAITCSTRKLKLMLFPKENMTKISLEMDRYSKPMLYPIEINGRPAVYFEGEQTHAFYVPEVPVCPLEQFNDQLLLLQVLLHEGKKVYHWFKNFFTEKSDQSDGIAKESTNTFITKATKNSWKERLDNIEKQLVDLNKSAQKNIDLLWVKHILEDRKQEFNYLNQFTEQNSEIVSAFNENLQVLQTELEEIHDNLGFGRKTVNTDSFTIKKNNLLAYTSSPCFFNTPKETQRIDNSNVLYLN